MTKEELEKEAEEWRNSLNYEIDNDTFNNIVIPCIEFGYNKCKEELNQKGLALQSDMDKTIEQNIALKKELNKANEWHYPSKGEYPKDENNVLCILGEFENINLEVGYYSQKENERERWRFSEYSIPDDSKDGWGVSAWKEIVLPELKESK